MQKTWAGIPSRANQIKLSARTTIWRPKQTTCDDQNKIDIWSFGCIVYELFNLEKLFFIRNPTKLRTSIVNFQVETDLNPGKIKPLYVRVVKK